MRRWLLIPERLSYHLQLSPVDSNVLQGGGNLSTRSNPNPPRARRKLVAISALIEHPTEGLILFETGTGKNYPGRTDRLLEAGCQD